LIKKIEIKFPAINFLSILVHQTLDPDPGSGSAIRKNAGSGSALNQCGSETLLKTRFPQYIYNNTTYVHELEILWSLGTGTVEVQVLKARTLKEYLIEYWHSAIDVCFIHSFMNLRCF
jgi:hypothetical protein